MLTDGCKELGVELDARKTALFEKYLQELKNWNKKINLTAITKDEDIIKKHFLDSLTPLKTIEELNVKKILDIGSGAGFPGIPLKIVDKDLSVTLMDSVEKKVLFMRHIIRTLGLSNPPGSIEAIHSRAEDPKTIEKYKNSFDAAITRAFSSLPDIIKMSLPYIKEGGFILAMKGPEVEKELAGIGITDVRSIKIPFEERVTKLVLIEKK